MAFLQLVVGLYWLWQLIWILFLLAGMAAVDDYEGLLVLQAGLSRYEGCWLTRLFLEFVQSAGQYPWEILVTATHMQNVLFLFLSILECLRSRHSRLWGVWFLVFLASLAVAVYSGFSSSSLFQVIILLRFTGSFGLVAGGILLLILLFRLLSLLVGARTDTI